MKKIFISFLFIFTLIQGTCLAVQLGSYNPDMEEGIFDRVKFNFFQKDKKFIEIVEPKTNVEREQMKEKFEATEYDRYKYMYSPTVAF